MDCKDHASATSPPPSSQPLSLAVAAPTFYSDGSNKVPEAIEAVVKDKPKQANADGPKKMAAVIADPSATASIPNSAQVVHQDISLPPSNSNQNDNAVLDYSSRNQNFAEKLHAILSTPRYSSILRWNTNGDAFSIHDIPEFVNTIMPTYFQRSKFDSFTRRMRRWGFRRMERMEERSRGLVIFRCACFRRDAPALCKSMCDDRQLKKKYEVSTSSSSSSSVASEVAYGYGSDHPHMRDQQSKFMHHSMPGPNPTAHKGHGEAVPVHFPSGHHHNPVDQSRSYWNPTVAHLPLPSSSQHQHPGQVYSSHPMEVMHPAMNPPYVVMDNTMHPSVTHYAPYAPSQHQHQPYPSQNISVPMSSMPMMYQPPGMPIQQDYMNNTMPPYPQYQQNAVNIQTLTPNEQFSGEQNANQYYMDNYQGLVNQSHQAGVASRPHLQETKQKTQYSQI